MFYVSYLKRHPFTCFVLFCFVLFFFLFTHVYTYISEWPPGFISFSVTNHQEGSSRHDATTQNVIWSNQPIHNLAISKQTSILWFFDNETGFRMGYRTLYHNRRDSEKYRKFHDSMLHSICIFRSRTAKNIAELYNNPDPYENLMSLIHSHEPLAKNVHVDIPGAPNDLPEIFKERLGNIYHWMEKCRQRLSVRTG